MLGTAQHSVVHVLGDHLQVVWGALLAFVIVVLLTPAVGGMARILGVVDAPGGRRVNRLPVPRLGGIALFLGIFVPALAFLPLSRDTRGLLLGAAIAVPVGAIDDFRGLRWWAKLAARGVNARGPGRRRCRADLVRRLGRAFHVPLRRRPRRPGVVGRAAGDHLD